jgi:hypothetical protein
VPPYCTVLYYTAGPGVLCLHCSLHCVAYCSAVYLCAKDYLVCSTLATDARILTLFCDTVVVLLEKGDRVSKKCSGVLPTS